MLRCLGHRGPNTSTVSGSTHLKNGFRKTTPMRIEYLFPPRKIALILASIAIFFALQSLVMEYLIENVLDQVHHATLIQLIDLFSVNAEQTIPTWYSILLLFGAAVLVASIAV